METDSKKYRVPLGKVVPRKMEKLTEPILEKGCLECRRAVGTVYLAVSEKE